MPTDTTTTVEHDTSALDAYTNDQNAKARARVLAASGLAALCAGAAIFLVCVGASYLWKPKIAAHWEGDQISLDGELGPHLSGPSGRDGLPGRDGAPGQPGAAGACSAEKCLRSDQASHAPTPIPQTLPALPPTPQVALPRPSQPLAGSIAPPFPGQRMSDVEFKQRQDFQTATTGGIIKNVSNGTVEFTNGKKFSEVDGNEQPVPWNTTEFNGSPAFCRPTGQQSIRSPDRIYFDCYALRNGVVESLDAKARQALAQLNTPIIPGVPNIQNLPNIDLDESLNKLFE